MSRAEETEPRSTLSYRDRLHLAYAARVDLLDPERGLKVDWFREYTEDTYGDHLRTVNRAEAVLLDVGCSRGYMLEAFRDEGFRHLHGVDISPVDIDWARRALPSVEFTCADARSFLETRPGSFDIVVMKAILEHTLKDEVLPLLEACANALRPGGVLIVDVPNMDWLFVGHERYMDFTHEVGFTRESLQQLMGLVFDSVEIKAVDHLNRIDRHAWRTRVGRAILGRLLRWADPQGAASPIWSRNLVAFGTRDMTND